MFTLLTGCMCECWYTAGVCWRWWYTRSSQHCRWLGVIPIQSIFTESCVDKRCRVHAPTSQRMCRLHCRPSHYQQSQGAVTCAVCLQQLFLCVVLFLSWWPWKQRLVWQSTASAEASFGPMRNPVCARVSVCMGGVRLLSYWQCVFSVCESLVLYIYCAQAGC